MLEGEEENGFLKSMANIYLYVAVVCHDTGVKVRRQPEGVGSQSFPFVRWYLTQVIWLNAFNCGAICLGQKWAVLSEIPFLFPS